MIKRFAKSLLQHTPFEVRRRTATNRFQAIGTSLESLKRRGFSPNIIIDGGANTGEFTKAMLLMFPEAAVHAIEPQPGCQAALGLLTAKARGRVFVHSIALSDPSSAEGSIILATDPDEISTGAHIASEADGGHTVAVPCQTLDSTMSKWLANGDEGISAPWFLKLDLQGYEMHALRGAEGTLGKTDVILTEVSFYAQAYEPPIAELVSFLDARGFELYDIASLYARPRDDRPRQGDFVFIRRDCQTASDRAWS